MLPEVADTLKIGAIIQVDLTKSLDGLTCVCNGPLVLMHGDIGRVVHDGMFPTVTNRGIEMLRKYVVAFGCLGGLRMLLSPAELQRPFELLHQGLEDAQTTPPAAS